MIILSYSGATLDQKQRTKTAVSRLENAKNELSDSSQETANILNEFFASV